MGSFPALSAITPLLSCALVVTTFLCIVVHYLVYSRRVAQWRKSNIPYLRPSFLIGHKYFLNLRKNSCLVSIDRIYKENADKDFVGFFLGTIPMVLVRKPWLIKQVFAKNIDKTFEPGLTGSKDDKVTQNILALSADKDVWKSERKALSPMFTTSQMSGEAFAKISKQIASMMSYTDEACRSGTPINATEASCNFVSDSVSHSFFGLEANSFEKKGELKQINSYMFEPSLTRILSAYAQAQFPGAQVFESLKYVNRKVIDSIKNLISQQIEQGQQNKSNENDFMALLTRLRDGQNAGKQDSGNDQHWTDNFIL